MRSLKPVLALTLVALVAFAQFGPQVQGQASERIFVNHPTTGVAMPVIAGPCGPLSPVPQVSVALQLTADTELVAVNAGVIHVCGFSGTFTGTTPSMRLIGGTGTVCGTNTAGLTGIYLPTAGLLINVGQAGSLLTKTTAGQALCADVGGTPVIGGVLTYAIL